MFTNFPKHAPRDRTSSTLIGWEGGAGPSSLLHTTLERPTDYVNARWMWGLHGFLRGIERIVFHGHLDYFLKPPLGGRPNTKPGDHGILNAHNRLFYSSCLQVQLVRCWYPPVFLSQIGIVYSINSSKTIGNFPAVVNFNRLFLELDRFVCN